MHLQEQHREESSSITHSPYYGCTVQVVSKAHISYEGVLDGISVNKDRIFLKNVRVKGNIIDSSDQDNSTEDLDTINSVMIDHLTNDMRIYDEVCLNIRDVQELKLIRLPATFHESKAKLRSIDPCLVDIRLSPSDEHDRMSHESVKDYSQSTPIARRTRDESIGSSGLLSSSSSESSPTISFMPGDLFIEQSLDDSFNKQFLKFSKLSTTQDISKPATLVAKKVLPKKIERNHFRPILTQNNETRFSSANGADSNVVKKQTADNCRKTSPIRVTITSKLNPNATPFFAPQRPRNIHPNSSFTFYERNIFRPPLLYMVPISHTQSIPSEIHPANPAVHHQQQQNHLWSYQRFVPPRQMGTIKQFNMQAPTPIYPASYSDKRSYPQQQSKNKTSNHETMPGLSRQTSSSSSVGRDPILSKPPIRERLSVPINSRPRGSPVVLCATSSLPYQNGKTGDLNPLQPPLTFGEPIGSRRGPRTVSGTSSGSSLSIDIGPHSIVQFDSIPDALISNEGQYDFEKANEEFCRYLALEELVTRRVPSVCSTGSRPDNDSGQQQSQANSYKKEISFFDRISCTATTGTAVGYAEMGEVEKNLETFGDDALLFGADSNDN
ncbi:unnamed protein product [Rotaria socialis]|uniref:Lsm14-like N-terminal domain-containing protein n=2 Tax=Rotaria socialis TaxID=392032 RepID=A0A819XKJ9_9BILA|nr:unnamed protein product [Rotaria socialis]CAF3357184.1 unnamed protein product [Rotaria socialis]CAF4143153.1 unnamed protein product [Rotaria socialis]